MRNLIKKIIVAWLRYWAQQRLGRIKPLVIAVAGSSGKTSTVAAIAAAVSETMRVQTSGGQNTETGVPLGILGIKMKSFRAKDWLHAIVRAPHAAQSRKKCDVYVAEYGIDHPGDMAELLKTCVPDIGVITSIGLEHAGYFPDDTLEHTLDAIADEELVLIRGLTEKGIGIIPSGDARITSRVHNIAATLLTVGGDDGATTEITHYQTDRSGTHADIFYNRVTYPVFFAMPVTRASVASVALAATAAAQAGVSFKNALACIARTWQVPPGRGRILNGKEGRIIIDSSYNATPDAVRDALQLLHDVGSQTRRVAILGDMRELGRHTLVAHASLADTIAATTDIAILIGPAMREHLATLLEGRVSRVVVYDTVTELIADIETLLEPDDTILVKGSQNTLFLERAVAHLLADPQDQEQLPRRGSRWDKVRAITP